VDFKKERSTVKLAERVPNQHHHRHIKGTFGLDLPNLDKFIKYDPFSDNIIGIRKGVFIFDS